METVNEYLLSMQFLEISKVDLWNFMGTQMREHVI